MSAIDNIPEALRDLWTSYWDTDHTFPFYEDENADITGYGHQDKDEFAAAVNEYDRLCNEGCAFPDDEQWDADDIGHGWAVVDFEREVLTLCDAATPGAVPITTLWGQR